MQGYGVVDLAAHAALAEVFLERIALREPHHELVVDVPHARQRRGQRHRALEPCALEGLVVEAGVLLPTERPGIEVLELDREHHRLQFIEPEVPAYELVVVLRLHAVHAHHRELRRERGVVGDAHTRITERTQILGREERQAADVADTAGAALLAIGRTDRLRGILDDPQAELVRQGHQRRHVGHLPIEMHRHQRADHGARGAVHPATVKAIAVLAQQPLDRRRGEVESGRVDVDE